MKIKPWKPYRFISALAKITRQMCRLSCCLISLHCESIPWGNPAMRAFTPWNWSIYSFIHSFIQLFIYNLRQEAWITHRARSTTISRKKNKKKPRKLVIQLTRMTILRNAKKRNANAKSELGRTSIKKQQHIRSSKLFNGRLVWHLIHTLLKVGGVSRS